MKLRITITILISALFLSACSSSRHAKCDAYGSVDNNEEIHST